MISNADNKLIGDAIADTGFWDGINGKPTVPDRLNLYRQMKDLLGDDIQFSDLLAVFREGSLQEKEASNAAALLDDLDDATDQQTVRQLEHGIRVCRNILEQRGFMDIEEEGTHSEKQYRQMFCIVLMNGEVNSYKYFKAWSPVHLDNLANAAQDFVLALKQLSTSHDRTSIIDELGPELVEQINSLTDSRAQDGLPEPAVCEQLRRQADALSSYAEAAHQTKMGQRPESFQFD